MSHFRRSRVYLSLIDMLSVACVLVLQSSLLAHPVSMSEVEIDVQPQRVSALVRIMLEDLTLHYPLKSGSDFLYPAKDLHEAAKKHQTFVLKNFFLRDGRGTQLKGKLRKLDASQIPAKGASTEDLKRKWLTYAVEYKLARPIGFLTVNQSFGGADFINPAIMECIVMQNGILLDSQQVLSQQAFSTKIDWKNPAKKARSLADIRKRRRERIKQRLGIASYAGLYSFIYITKREVRHEILIPLLTMERWIPIQRRDKDFLSIREQERAKKAIRKYFAKRNPLKINGKKSKPVFSRISFFGLDINDFALNAKPRKVSVYQARVGLIIRYKSKQPPNNVDMHWDTFHKYAPFLRSVLYVHNKKPSSVIFRPDGKGFQWKNSGKKLQLPTVKLVTDSLAGQVTNDVAIRVVSKLLPNVYRSFEFNRDGDVYDALAKSCQGDLLRQIYLQIKRSLLVAEQGGARATVQSVRVVDGKLSSTSKQGFALDCRWRVVGTVEHWGHIHTRENQYGARFHVARTADGWKISSYKFADQKRIRFQTQLRR